MSEGIQKVLTMQDGKASWRKMTGGVDLEGLSGGQLFVREAREEIIASYNLGSYQPQDLDDGDLLYVFESYAGPELVDGTKYRVKIFEQTWDVTAEKVVLPTDGSTMDLVFIGNPWFAPGFREDFGQEDNGLPFGITAINGMLMLGVRAAEFAMVTVDPDQTSTSFVVWEVHDKELVSLPVVMLFSNDGTTLADAEGNFITDYTEICAGFEKGQTVLLTDDTEPPRQISALVCACRNQITFGSGKSFSNK